MLDGIDAQALSSCKPLAGQQFDKIVFNFPHLGVPVADETRNVALHQKLLLMFLKEAEKMLAPEGQIHVTLKAGPR